MAGRAIERIRRFERTEPIERIDPPTMKAFRRDHVRPAVPVIIERAAWNWPAFELWDAEYLKATAGHERVPVEVSEDREFAVPERFGRDLIHTEFSRYVDYLATADSRDPVTYYLAQLDMKRYLPELQKDVIRPAFAPRFVRSKPPFLWMGIGRNASRLHFDEYDNLYVVLRGRKHVILFPPEDREYLYPYDKPKVRHFSRIDLRRPDFDRFPKLRYARAYECVLSPGDMLYIPESWWHHLRSHGLNFAVNWWWIEPQA